MPHLHRQSLLATRLMLVAERLVPQALRTLFHFEKLSREYLISVTYLISGFPTGQAWFSRLKKKRRRRKAVVRLCTLKGATCWGYF